MCTDPEKVEYIKWASSALYIGGGDTVLLVVTSFNLSRLISSVDCLFIRYHHTCFSLISGGPEESTRGNRPRRPEQIAHV